MTQSLDGDDADHRLGLDTGKLQELLSATYV